MIHVIAVLALALLVGLVRLHRRWHAFQYLFFWRVPLLTGTFLFAFPFVATCSRAKGLLENLFALDGPGLCATTVCVALVAQAAVNCWALLYERIPERYLLNLRRADRDSIGNREITRFTHWAAVACATLSAPTVIVATLRAEARIAERAGYLVLAIVLIALEVRALAWLSPRIEARWHAWFGASAGATERRGRVRSFARAKLERLPRVGYGRRKRRLFTHEIAVAFVLLSGLIYLAGFLLLHPTRGLQTAQLPALAYLLWIVLLGCLVLSGASFFLDVFRIPLLFGVAGLSLIASLVVDEDHAFETRGTPASDRSWTRRDYASNWIARHPGQPMIVVAASGGGITAARWTAEVLCGLSEAPELGERFARSIALVSSTSGGGVGALLYLDSWKDGRPPAPARLDSIRELSGRSSLNWVAWGLAYPDFWRFLCAPLARFAAGPFEDRGWAMQTRWRQGLLHGDDWLLSETRDRVRTGEQPAQVFNATLVETGERLALEPFDPSGGPISAGQAGSGPRTRTLTELWPGSDVTTLTAARLSSTFPFVTPVAGPVPSGGGPVLHVADGGYYDNSGLVGALEFLLDVNDLAERPERVVLVEIRAFPPNEEQAEPLSGWASELYGPLRAMLAVRTAGQRTRNEIELELVARLAREARFEFHPIHFELARELSLSWHLRADEIEAIEGCFRQDPDCQAAKEELRRLLE